MNSGRSLAISSANSETTNRIEKIQNDQKPRRLALKFCQRRSLIVLPFRRAGAAGPRPVGGGFRVVSSGGGAVIVIRPPASRNRFWDRSTYKSDPRSG